MNLQTENVEFEPAENVELESYTVCVEFESETESDTE